MTHVRKLFFSTAVLFLAAVVSTTVVSAQATKVKYEAELRAIYPKLDVALKAKDLKKLTAFYDEKYTLSSDGKTLDRAAAVDQWKSVLDFMQKVDKLQTRIEKVAIVDGNYVVDYSQSSSGQVQFPGSPVLPFTYDSKVTDTWTRDKKGVWKTVSSKEHKADFKVNGESAKAPN